MSGESQAAAVGPEDVAKPRRRRKKGQAGQFDLRRDIIFAYMNLDADPDALLPPSAGALRLLKWAKANEKEFFKNFVGKLMPKDGKGQGDDKPAEEQAEGFPGGLDEWMERWEEERERKRREQVRRWTLDECRKRLEEDAAGVVHDYGEPEGEAQPPAPAVVLRHQPAPEPVERPAAPATSPHPVVIPHPLCGDCNIHGAKADCPCCAHLRQYAPQARTAV